MARFLCEVILLFAASLVAEKALCCSPAFLRLIHMPILARRLSLAACFDCERTNYAECKGGIAIVARRWKSICRFVFQYLV